jgi:hypothetical protein
VSGDGLTRYKPNREYITSDPLSTDRNSDPRDDPKKQRHIAFRRDAIELRDDKFWHRYIMSRSEAREITREQLQNDESQQDDGTSQERQDSGAAPRSSLRDCFVLFGGQSDIQIPRTALQTCQYLREREQYDEHTRRCVVDLWNDERAYSLGLERDEFKRLSVYFETGNIGPAFLDRNGCEPFGPLTADKKAHYMELLGSAFITATKIQHHALQDVLLEKIRGLYPLPTTALLDLAETFSSSPDAETDAESYLRDWIVDHMVECWDLLKERGREELCDVFARNEGLKRAVQAKLRDRKMSQASSS